MSYVTLSEAQDYFDSRLHSEVWDEASTANQTKALNGAFRIIENLRYRGCRYSLTQSTQFPRYPINTVPDNIKYALYEIAHALLDGVDMEQEIDALHGASFNYATLRSDVDEKIYPEHILAGVPSAVAWRYLQPYLANALNLRLNRVN